jgi:hypothetical protein
MSEATPVLLVAGVDPGDDFQACARPTLHPVFYNEKPRARDLKNRGLAPILSEKADEQFADAVAHFARPSKHPAFAPDVDPYIEKVQRATGCGDR